MQVIPIVAFPDRIAKSSGLLGATHVEHCCTDCSSREHCLPAGLSQADIARLGGIMSSRRKVPRHATVYQQGDRFDKLYEIKLGHFKKYHIAANTPDRVISFPLAGELLGMEAIFTGRYACCAQALDDSEVCEIAFPSLEKLFADIPALLIIFIAL